MEKTLAAGCGGFLFFRYSLMFFGKMYLCSEKRAAHYECATLEILIFIRNGKYIDFY